MTLHLLPSAARPAACPAWCAATHDADASHTGHVYAVQHDAGAVTLSIGARLVVLFGTAAPAVEFHYLEGWFGDTTAEERYLLTPAECRELARALDAVADEAEHHGHPIVG